MAETRTTSSTGGQKGVKLARFDLIPAGPLRELAEHYGRGARKYASHQWRQGYEWSKSIAALGRHFNDFQAGKDYDVCENDPTGCSFVDAEGEPFEGEVTEHGHTCFNHTGSHHLVAVAWHSFLLLEFKDTHPGHDDRYKASTELDREIDRQIESLLDYCNNRPPIVFSVKLKASPRHVNLTRKIDAPSAACSWIDSRGAGWYWSPRARAWRSLGKHRA